MPIPTDVRNAMVSAYYPRALSVPDAARARAQAGYGIAAAIAAAVVAAGVFGDLRSQALAVQILGVSALVLWLVAAGLFLVAVSRPFQHTQAAQTSVDAFVTAALQAAAAERKKVDRWQTLGSITSGIAAAVTVAALVVALAVASPSDARAATVRLTHRGASSVGFVCGTPHSKLNVSLEPGDLAGDFVAMTLAPGQCGPRQVDISVPRSQLLAVVYTGR